MEMSNSDDNDFFGIDLENVEFDEDDNSEYIDLNSFFDNNRSSESIEQILENNKRTKCTELKLYGNDVHNIPDVLKEYYWVDTLILDSTNITVITDDLPPNLKKFICKLSHIPEFDASVLPNSVTSLVYTHNNTTQITGFKNGLIEIVLSNNFFKKINCKIPSGVVKLILSGNALLSASPELPESLIEYNINNTGITSIDNLPDEIEILYTCKCNIEIVNKLPKNLKVWKNFVSQTEKINCEFPVSLKSLDLYNNFLSEVPELGPNIVDVDLGDNDLILIPKCYPTIKSIDLKQNNKLKTSDVEKLKKEIPHATILYDDPNNFATFNCSNYFPYNSNYSSSVYQPQINFSRSAINKFDKNDPNTVVFKKTYLL